MSSPAANPPGRKLFRFGMRTLLALVALVALWLAYTMRSVRTQRDAVAVIQSSGGTILYDYHENGLRTWSTSGTPSGPGWARKFLGPEYFDRVVYVGLFNTPDNDEWIEGFNRLKDVKTLLLSGSHVTDTTLIKMDRSDSLLELHLTNTAVTDEGLRALGKFPNLRWLIANGTSVTDEGMIHLLVLRDLQDVNVANTRVSKEAVDRLRANIAKRSVER